MDTCVHDANVLLLRLEIHEIWVLYIYCIYIYIKLYYTKYTNVFEGVQNTFVFGIKIYTKCVDFSRCIKTIGNSRMHEYVSRAFAYLNPLKVIWFGYDYRIASKLPLYD